MILGSMPGEKRTHWYSDWGKKWRASETTYHSAPWVEALRPFQVLTVPGLDGSNPEHWQSRWEEELPRRGILCARVEQNNWRAPNYVHWAQALEHAVLNSHYPVLLAAHSLGAILSVRWSAANPRIARHIAGALLVAPADTERHEGEDKARVTEFTPLPRSQLPFPAIVAASGNDPWLSTERGRMLAQDWGATFVPTGQKGHMGNAARLGRWSAGLILLGQLAERCQWPRK